MKRSTPFSALLAGLISFIAISTTALTQTESVLHGFQSGNKHDGILPMGSLAADANGALYGVTQQGGANGFGCVYKLTLQNGSWKENILYSFTGTGSDGRYPQGSVLLLNRKIYGTTQQGGVNASGTVYELTPPVKSGDPWTENVIFTFTGGKDGKWPVAGLIAGSRGQLYGTTSSGGDVNLDGVVFALMPPASQGGSWTQRIVHTFQGGADGRDPVGNLIPYGGTLVGTTYQGGQFGFGTVYQLTPAASGAWTNKVLYSFQGGTDSGNPIGAPTADVNGALYGTTSLFLAASKGTVFQLVPPSSGSGSWTLNTLYAFQDGSDGGFPQTGVTLDGQGNVYGVAQQGGSVGCGVAFKLIFSGGAWNQTVLHDFAGVSASDGCFPSTPLLLLGTDLYGTTNAGGPVNGGTAYKIIP